MIAPHLPQRDMQQAADFTKSSGRAAVRKRKFLHPAGLSGMTKRGSPSASPFLEFWSGRRVSNSRPQPWQGCALPTELLPHRGELGRTSRRMFGAGDESRTRDLNLGKVALYQLSYSRTSAFSEECVLYASFRICQERREKFPRRPLQAPGGSPSSCVWLPASGMPPAPRTNGPRDGGRTRTPLWGGGF